MSTHGCGASGGRRGHLLIWPIGRGLGIRCPWCSAGLVGVNPALNSVSHMVGRHRNVKFYRGRFAFAAEREGGENPCPVTQTVGCSRSRILRIA